MNRGAPDYGSLEVSELFCPRCKRSQPVHRHLLLVLPTGRQYEYRCSVCAAPVGAKTDDDTSEFAEILRRS